MANARSLMYLSRSFRVDSLQSLIHRRRGGRVKHYNSILHAEEVSEDIDS